MFVLLAVTDLITKPNHYEKKIEKSKEFPLGAKLKVFCSLTFVTNHHFQSSGDIITTYGSKRQPHKEALTRCKGKDALGSCSLFSLFMNQVLEPYRE